MLMIKIFQESSNLLITMIMYIIDQTAEYTTLYTLHGAVVHKKRIYDPLSHVLRDFSSTEKTPITLLLDERFFAYYHFSIKLTADEPYTIDALKQLIDKKIEEIRIADRLSSPHVLHRIEHISVDGVAHEYVL